ncbi:hypothetical protein GGR21_001837 [Dysgonomonas hofstadii]|uniref:Uncharacterized protein n=1 Tax=Dysgonomonas hofstadii TaxID=637886 RepID=A0A840CTV6_9BACT|nr:hypothetical protein [Dysgonomonas hofstadii]
MYQKSKVLLSFVMLSDSEISPQRYTGDPSPPFRMTKYTIEDF